MVMNWGGVLILLMNLRLVLVMMIMWRLNGDLHGHRLLLVDRQWDVLLMDDWSVDWDVNLVRHCLLHQVWLLNEDLNRSWNWVGLLHMHLLDHINLVWSVHLHMDWILHVLDDIHWVFNHSFNWIRSVNMAVNEINHRSIRVSSLILKSRWSLSENEKLLLVSKSFIFVHGLFFKLLDDLHWVGTIDWNLNFISNFLDHWVWTWHIDLLDDFYSDLLLVDDWVRLWHVDRVFNMLNDLIGCWHKNCREGKTKLVRFESSWKLSLFSPLTGYGRSTGT
jgi:hypothetical protein